MGGEVLELMRERAERLEREAEARGHELGREEGREEGRAEGRLEGREQGIDALANLLREQGVDEGLIRISIESLKHEGEEICSADDQDA